MTGLYGYLCSSSIWFTMVFLKYPWWSLFHKINHLNCFHYISKSFWLYLSAKKAVYGEGIFFFFFTRLWKLDGSVQILMLKWSKMDHFSRYDDKTLNISWFMLLSASSLQQKVSFNFTIIYKLQTLTFICEILASGPFFFYIKWYVFNMSVLLCESGTVSVFFFLLLLVLASL